MNAHRQNFCGDATGADAGFPMLSRAMFAASYPEGTHKLRHNLGAHPLFEFETLARLGEGLPASAVERVCGDLPNAANDEPDDKGLSAGEMIRRIGDVNGWVVLKAIERIPAYAALLADLRAELEAEIVARTGRLLELQGSVFISGPNVATPYPSDSWHTIVLQLVGAGAITVFPAGNSPFVADVEQDGDYTDGARGLAWREELAHHGITFNLEPGDATYIPVGAPHHVRNGSEPSISLSIAWRSAWYSAEADARAFNDWLRNRGFDPPPPERWPASNRARSIAWRLLRRLPGID